MTQPILETEPKSGETADQFKARINETQRELERQQRVTPGSSSGSTNNEPTGEAQVKSGGAVAQPQGTPPAPATSGVNSEVEEWWKKKGFKSQDDVANSYRELERELNKKNQELARQNIPQVPPSVPPAQGVPGYPSYQQNPMPNYWQTPQPSYVPMPSVNPVPTQQTLEHLAKQYGLTPEDFEKVYAVANDLSKVNVQAELNRIMPGITAQVRQVNQEVTRQREMVDLMSEPTWKNQQVQFEMHKVLQEDPAIVQRQALPFRYAHDEALKRIARVNLGGSSSFQQAPTQPLPASSGGKPPMMAGSNGKGAEGAPSGSGTGEMTQEQFAALPLKDKQHFLRTLGALGR